MTRAADACRGDGVNELSFEPLKRPSVDISVTAELDKSLCCAASFPELRNSPVCEREGVAMKREPNSTVTLLRTVAWHALLSFIAVGAVAAPNHAPTAATAPVREEGMRWESLTRAQREALSPLERDWPSIEAWRKEKWLTIAGRYESLTSEQRTHMRAQMTEWARLTPAERGLARIRFEEVRQVPAKDRLARWQAYQALPAEQRAEFAARAARHAPSANSVDGSGRTGSSSPTMTMFPRLVAPTLVQAGPGATTTLISRHAAPSPHPQHGPPSPSPSNDH